MPRFCTQCGKLLKDDERFCTSCGTPVTDDGQASQSQEDAQADVTVQSAHQPAPAPQSEVGATQQ